MPSPTYVPVIATSTPGSWVTFGDQQVFGEFDVRSAAVGCATPATHGLKVWSFPVSEAASAAVVAAGTLVLSALYVTRPIVATALRWHVSAAASAPVAGQNFVALYSQAGGAPMAQASADTDVTTTGVKSLALPSFAMAPGEVYYAAWLFNATTAPQMPRCGGAGAGPSLININLPAAALRFATNGAGLTALPSLTPASSTTGQGYWAALEGSEA